MAARWTAEEDVVLRSLYPNSSKKEILNSIGKDWLSIRRRAGRLGLRRSPDRVKEDRMKENKKPRKDAWTPEEESLLKEIYPHNTKDYILSKIKRQWKGIWSRAYHLGLVRDAAIVKSEMIEAGSSVHIENRWTAEEDAILKEHYLECPREDLLKKLPGRTWKAIRSRSFVLKVKRGDAISRLENSLYTRRAMLEKHGVEYSTQLPSMKKKSRETNLAKRGVEYPTQSAEVRDKVRDTVKDRYGVDNVFQSEEVKDKIKSSNIDKYGVPSPLQNDGIKEKVKKTNNKRYGVDNPFQLRDQVEAGMIEKYGEKTPLLVPEIEEKRKNTSLLRYGTEYPQLSPEIKSKIECTNIERYGYSTPLKNKEVKNRIRRTCIDRYGVHNPACSSEIKEKAIKTNLERYGYEHTMQVPEIRQKGYETSKNNKSFTKSKPEIAFKEYLKLFDPATKQHVAHPSLRNVMDYYMPGLDLWVQFDGDYWHGRVKRANKSRHTDKIKRTMERDRIQNEQVPNLIRFWSSDVKKSIDDGSILEFVLSKIKDKVDINICHQYNRKVETYREDMQDIGFEVDGVGIKNIVLNNEPLSTEITAFIERYEWLGNIGVSPKWCFTARYDGRLLGVVLINEPTSYSKILGDDTIKYEALIQRGATASWAPANTGSKLIMYACKWMVCNTNKRAFVAYGDPSAGEIGAIYQACNFEYLGNNFGDSHKLRHPEVRGGKEFSSHALNRTSSFKKWCRDSGIRTDPEWFNRSGFKVMSRVPEDIRDLWRWYKKRILSEAEKIPIAKKHKYAIVIGLDKREKRYLNGLKTYKSKPYPKKPLKNDSA